MYVLSSNTRPIRIPTTYTLSTQTSETCTWQGRTGRRCLDAAPRKLTDCARRPQSCGSVSLSIRASSCTSSCHCDRAPTCPPRPHRWRILSGWCEGHGVRSRLSSRQTGRSRCLHRTSWGIDVLLVDQNRQGDCRRLLRGGLGWDRGIDDGGWYVCLGWDLGLRFGD